MYLYRPDEKNNRLKLIILGLLLIALLSGLFYFKNYLTGKNGKEVTAPRERTMEEVKPVSSVSPQEVFLSINSEQTQIIDIRPEEDYKLDHIESSINMPLTAENPELPSQFINKEKKIIIVEELPTTLGEKVVSDLLQKGYQAKYLKDGLAAFRLEDYGLISFGLVDSPKDKAKVNFISTDELINRSKKGEKFVFLDVRHKEDFAQNRIENSINLPLELIEKNKKEIPLGKIILVDENPVRSFQAAVRLFDMNIIGVYCLDEGLSALKEKLKIGQ